MQQDEEMARYHQLMRRNQQSEERRLDQLTTNFIKQELEQYRKANKYDRPVKWETIMPLYESILGEGFMRHEVQDIIMGTEGPIEDYIRDDTDNIVVAVSHENGKEYQYFTSSRTQVCKLLPLYPCKFPNTESNLLNYKMISLNQMGCPCRGAADYYLVKTLLCDAELPIIILNATRHVTRTLISHAVRYLAGTRVNEAHCQDGTEMRYYKVFVPEDIFHGVVMNLSEVSPSFIDSYPEYQTVVSEMISEDYPVLGDVSELAMYPETVIDLLWTRRNKSFMAFKGLLSPYLPGRFMAESVTLIYPKNDEEAEAVVKLAQLGHIPSIIFIVNMCLYDTYKPFTKDLAIDLLDSMPPYVLRDHVLPYTIRIWEPFSTNLTDIVRSLPTGLLEQVYTRVTGAKSKKVAYDPPKPYIESTMRLPYQMLTGWIGEVLGNIRPYVQDALRCILMVNEAIVSLGLRNVKHKWQLVATAVVFINEYIGGYWDDGIYGEQWLAEITADTYTSVEVFTCAMAICSLQMKTMYMTLPNIPKDKQQYHIYTPEFLLQGEAVFANPIPSNIDRVVPLLN